MTRSVRIISSLVVAALLSGCAIGPDYKRPAVARPETFRGQATAEAASLADVPWWEAFQDPILKGLIHDALGSNYDVRIAAARVQEARESRGGAIGLLPLPRLWRQRVERQDPPRHPRGTRRTVARG
jgi:multidrug efflux system outer membrane protein